MPADYTQTSERLRKNARRGNRIAWIKKRNCSTANSNWRKKSLVLHNDYSERAFQLERSGQWVKGKSCDTFAPIGPFIATADEVADPQALDLWLKVNGETLQNSSTSDMAYGVRHLVHYLSQFMTLLPGAAAADNAADTASADTAPATTSPSPGRRWARRRRARAAARVSRAGPRGAAPAPAAARPGGRRARVLSLIHI